MHATRFIVALTALATLAACGKTDNLPSERLLEFPNVLPEKPVELTGAAYEPWTSSRAIAARGDELLVVDADNDTLVVMDQAGLTVQATIPVGSKPEHVLVGPEGNAWVTVRGAGEVVRIAADNSVAARAEVGSEPFAMALRTDNGARLYVTLSEDDAVVALDPTTLALSELAETLDTPRGMVLSGTYLHVIHHHEDTLVLPLGQFGSFQRDSVSGQPLAGAASLRRGVPSDHMANRGGLGSSFPARALAGTVHPQTGEVFIAHVEAHPGTENDFLDATIDALDPSRDEPVVTSGYGSAASTGTRFNVPTRPIETSVTSVRRDGVANTTFSDHPVQDPKTGEPMTHLISQPSDINHHPTHSLALVTGYGSDQVLVLNTDGPDPMLSPLGLVEVGWAPKAVTFSQDGTRAFVLNHQSFSVSEIDLTPFFDMRTEVKLPVIENEFDRGFAPMMEEDGDTDAVQPASPYTRSANTAMPLNLRAKRSASYGADPRTAAVKRGQRVFTFARNGNMSHAGQFACATCHFEGREDKLVWVIDDGPRQTPALAGRLQDTAPFNWAGSKPQLQGNMVQTVDRMGGQGLNANEIEDLETFLLSMDAVPNPNLSPDGTLSEMQAWGKEIFFREDVGCGTCHTGPAQTDGRNHDVGTATEIEREVFQRRKQAGATTAEGPAVLNTPTLRGLFYTAPYLHDGSAETLHDVLDLAPEMGHPGVLSADEKDALVAYLLTL